MQLFVYLILGGLLLTDCETFVVTPYEDSVCTSSNDSSSTHQPLNCYYTDQNFLQSTIIIMMFLNGSHVGNEAETILLQQVRKFKLVGESGANIASLHIVIMNHVCVMIENVTLS